MVDVWWGVVERAGPRRYNWTSYLQLVDIVDQVGLKIQFVTSFRTPTFPHISLRVFLRQ
jgi:beta-amylase